MTVTEGDGATVTQRVTYTYDAFDRRLSQSVDPDGDGPTAATTEHFIYDGDHIALVFDEAGNQTHRYLHGPNVDQILAEETANADVHWALTDHQGSVRGVIDNSGNILNRIVYDSFGQVTSETNPDFDFRFGYTGRERDEVTGLMYYRARYYDPAVGRFLSEDPLGFAAGDANLYRYVFNSPTNYTDPSGEIAFAPVVIGVIVIGAAVNLVVPPPPVQAPTDCDDFYDDEYFWQRLGAGLAVGAAPGIARGLGRSIAQQLPQLLDDFARGVGSIGDDIGRTLAGSGDELVPVLPRGGRFPTGAVDDFNPAAPLRSQGNPGPNNTPNPPVGRRTTIGETGPDGIQPSGAGRHTPQHVNSPLQPVQNSPANINGRQFSGHALDQMINRGLTPTVVENAIQTGTRSSGNTSGTTLVHDAVNNVTAILNNAGDVITTY